MYEYGLLLSTQENEVEGKKYIEKSANEGYKKAKQFLLRNKTKDLIASQKKSDIFLRLNPKGHYGRITDFLQLNNSTIISSSTDKTIKVWNVNNKKVASEFLGEISDSIGEINSIAINNDKTLLAVGGNLGIKNKGTIRIYNVKNKKIVKIIESGSAEVFQIKFSEDGQYLIASSGNKIFVWNLPDYSLYAITTTLSESISTLEILNINNENIIIASDKREIFSFSLLTKKGRNLINIVDKRVLDVVVGKQFIFTLDINNVITTYDLSLNKISLTKVPNVAKIFASPNSSFFIAMTKNEDNLRVFNVYTMEDILIKKFSIDTYYHLSMINGTFTTENNFVCSDVSDNNIDIWNIPKRMLVSSLKRDKGSTFTFIQSSKKRLSIYNKVMKSFAEYDYISNSILFNDVVSNYNEYKQLPHKNNKYELKSVLHASSLEIKDIKTQKNSMILVGKIVTFGILPNNNIVVCGRDRQYGDFEKTNTIFMYTSIGEKIAELHGHEAPIGSFTFDSKQNLLFSADISGVVKIWDLNTFSSNVSTFELDENKLNITRNESSLDSVTFNNLIDNQIGLIQDNWFKNWLVKYKYEQELGNTLDSDIIKMFRNSLKKVQHIKPIASIYIGENNEWVMWTEDGFFDASKNGAKYIGYHINQGFDKEAKFITSDQVYNEFYRPDIVKKALNKEDVSRYAKEINIDKIVKGGLAPEVKFLTRRTVTNKRDVDLNAKVCDTGGGIGDVIVSLNGTNIKVDASNRQPLPKVEKNDDQCYQVDMLVTLQNGTNELKLFAFNEKGTIESDIDSLQIDNKLKQSVKSDLYLLNIAVNKYMDKSLQLKYPVDDAIAIEKAMQNITGTLFDNTKIIKLYDNNVSKKSIAKVFESISKEIKPDDVFMMFMAGHGVTDDGKYYFLPYDFKFTGLDSIQKYGVSIDDLKDGLLKIPAQKSLVLLDTCSSGAFTNDIMSRGLEEKMAIARLHRATGRNYIAASSDDQVALEGYEGHGVFTYTIVDALEGKGFKNGKLTVVDLAKYVEDVLPEISYKKWGYMQVPQKSLSGSDFPIGLK